MKINNMSRISKKVSFFFVAFFFLFSLIGSVSADSFFESSTGLKTAGEKTGHTQQSFFNSADSLEGGIANIIMMLLSLVGIIFFVLLVYGGVFWMTARGNETQATKAKNIVINSVTGLAVILLAYAISVFIINVFM